MTLDRKSRIGRCDRPRTVEIGLQFDHTNSVVVPRQADGRAGRRHRRWSEAASQPSIGTWTEDKTIMIELGEVCFVRVVQTDRCRASREFVQRGLRVDRSEPCQMEWI